MKALKTQPTDKSVDSLINNIDSESVKEDCQKLVEIMESIVGEKPKVWGDSIVGFGHYHYKYKSGRENDWFRIGFAKRAKYISIYTMCYLDDNNPFLKGLGKYKKGKACLNINALEDINIEVLKDLLKHANESLD